MRRAIIMCAAAILVASCNVDTPTDPTSGTIEPTFSSIQSKLFNPSCTTSSCHGSTGKGGLTLVAGSSYAALINVRSENDGAHTPKFFRVLPGKPDSSFLYIKLTSPSSLQGDRMPQVGSALSQQYTDAVRTWIQNGALNN